MNDSTEYTTEYPLMNFSLSSNKELITIYESYEYCYKECLNKSDLETLIKQMQKLHTTMKYEV